MRTLLVLLGSIGFVVAGPPFEKSALIFRDPQRDRLCHRAVESHKCKGCVYGSIVGRVRHARSGRPISATVMLTWTGEGPPSAIPKVHVDSNGYFVIANSKGDKWVEVFSDGYDSMDAMIGPGQFCIDVYLAPEAAARARVAKPISR